MNPNHSASNAGSAAEWLEHAHSDLQLARLGCANLDVLPNQAAFHAQQAAEKAIKAVLVDKQISFPRTHDLQDLIELLQTANVSWPFAVNEVEGLTPYAVQTRYPGALSQVNRSEVTGAIAVAEKVVAWAREQTKL